MVAKPSHQSDHAMLRDCIYWNGLAVISGSRYRAHNHSTLRLLLPHEVHCQLDGIHLADEGHFEAREFRLGGIAVVIFVVEVVAPIAESCIWDDNLTHNDDDSAATSIVWKA
jgi:hypothetical protein